MSNEPIDTFVINAVLIDPIADIVSKLEKKEFRDCDIIWLENKLKGYVDFAAQTLDVIVPAVFDSEMKGVIINEHTTARYLKDFKTLLEYFKQWG